MEPGPETNIDTATNRQFALRNHELTVSTHFTFIDRLHGTRPENKHRHGYIDLLQMYSFPCLPVYYP